jgi:hypothetical protein
LLSAVPTNVHTQTSKTEEFNHVCHIVIMDFRPRHFLQKERKRERGRKRQRKKREEGRDREREKNKEVVDRKRQVSQEAGV